MTMTISVNTLIESKEALLTIAGMDQQSGKARYAFKPKAKMLLSKRLRTVTSMTETVNEERTKMLKECNVTGERDEKGISKDKTEDITTFNNAWGEYMKEEVIAECDTIDIELLDLDKNDIPVNLLTVLDWLIPFKEDAAASAPAG
jgi:hypothetical protein